VISQTLDSLLKEFGLELSLDSEQAIGSLPIDSITLVEVCLVLCDRLEIDMEPAAVAALSVSEFDSLLGEHSDQRNW
jgi:hypothetical protein